MPCLLDSGRPAQACHPWLTQDCLVRFLGHSHLVLFLDRWQRCGEYPWDLACFQGCPVLQSELSQEYLVKCNQDKCQGFLPVQRELCPDLVNHRV